MPKDEPPGPFKELCPYHLSVMFRALSNAALALNQFTNQQNYGPAIQQLIYDLGRVCEDSGLEFDLEKLADSLAEVCDHLDADEFQVEEDTEFKHFAMHLWDHTVTAEQRLAFYKQRYRFDRELNPVEENAAEP